MSEVCQLANCTDSCALTCLGSDTSAIVPGNLIGTVILVIMSGSFSGLTLGLMSLTCEGLDIFIKGGSPNDQKWARRIYPLRKRGNLLLCTLLLGNTLVNTLIAILSAEMSSGLVGGLISTGAIVIFGEIIPQAVCARHGLRIGAASVWVLVPVMILLLPVTLPLAMILDAVLGAEVRVSYNKQQLDKLLEMHSTQQAITKDDKLLLSSALTFSAKRVRAIMTPQKDVFMISLTDVLSFENLKAIYASGYTRIPVYRQKRSCVVGVLFAKDLILVDPNDEIPVASMLPFCARSVNCAHQHTTLERMLQEMQSSRAHLWFVSRGNETNEEGEHELDGEGESEGDATRDLTLVAFPPRRKVAAAEDVVGIVTMEDLIEELISDEIIDESDTITDNISKNKVLEQRAPQRLEFFEMLQRKEVMEAGKAARLTTKSVDEVRALTSYLASNVAQFRPHAFSNAALRRLVQRCPIYVVDVQKVQQGCFVYVSGIPASYCCLLLHGRLQVRSGNENFTTEIGPWRMLASNALTDDNYIPDFTAKVIAPARIFIVARKDFQTIPSQEWAGLLKSWYHGAAAQTEPLSSISVDGHSRHNGIDSRPRHGSSGSGVSSHPSRRRKKVPLEVHSDGGERAIRSIPPRENVPLLEVHSDGDVASSQPRSRNRSLIRRQRLVGGGSKNASGDNSDSATDAATTATEKPRSSTNGRHRVASGDNSDGSLP
mmetsp:Transcript_73347/g.122521  ORF Transcript_73347/g.122521 Transcript_73347/m.122521 type:complete len:715 (+) Transcript_73347:68-2212(+)